MNVARVRCAAALATAALAVVVLPAASSPLVGATTAATTESSLFRSGAAASFARLERRHGVTAGIAAGPAVPGARAWFAGHWRYQGQARSTIKVPLSYAVMSRYGGFAQAPKHLRRDMRRALRRSDNAATERLLASFGSRDAAARAVDRGLARAGDRRTHLLRAGAWGATTWSLRRQQRYMTQVRCIAHGPSLMAQMRHVTRSQRWGLGRLDGRPAFKGGWGTGADGKVRQLGLVEVAPGRTVAVAIYANAHDQSFARAKRALSAVSRWLTRWVVAARVDEPSCAQ